MKKAIALTITTITLLITTGCVERELTVNTNPQGAIVELNDEEIGISPVTVNFNWYGDYKVRIKKQGYQTLNTNMKLDRPTHDYFPFDIFADIFTPNKIDSYCWEFDLREYQPVDRKVLIDSATIAKEKIDLEIDQAREKADKLITK